MSIGVAASDLRLAEATFRQACFDLKNGKRLIHLKLDGRRALAVSQIQQCCEKALKAVLLVEAGRVLYGQTVKPSHRIWSEDLKDSRLTHVRRKLEKALIRQEEKVEFDSYLVKLESYAPRMAWRHENTEYPWVDTAGKINSPVEYFEKREVEVFNIANFSRSLLKKIKIAYHPQFADVWNEVEEIDG